MGEIILEVILGIILLSVVVWDWRANRRGLSAARDGRIHPASERVCPKCGVVPAPNMACGFYDPLNGRPARCETAASLASKSSGA